MDSAYKYRIQSSWNFPNLGIIVEISGVESGFTKGTVLKSVSLGIYWEVQSRIIQSLTEKRFECETEIFTHTNIRETETLQKLNINFKNHFEYNLKPIGHHQKPAVNDFLVFSSTVAVRMTYKVIAIYDDYLLLDTKNQNTGVLHKKYVSPKAKVGDYVRHCENKFHDLVDENGDLITERI